LRIESCAGDHVAQCSGRVGAADTGLEPDCITSNESLNELNSRQQQRVIARADNENNTKCFALNLAAHAREPEWTSAFAEALWLEEFSRFPFEKATSIGERENFCGQ
jgi:hypothetical protein